MKAATVEQFRSFKSEGQAERCMKNVVQIDLTRVRDRIAALRSELAVLEALEQYCRPRPTREVVEQVVFSSAVPLKTAQIAEEVRNAGHSVANVTVYQSLERLAEKGRVVRVGYCWAKAEAK